MAGVNKVLLIGRLGKDPEIRYMQDGTAVTNFSVATSETWQDKQSGEKKEKTEWHKIVIWRKLAEIAGKYLKKGSQVYLEGKLRGRSYEKDAQTHYITEVEATEMQMLDKKPDSGDRQENRGQQQSQQQSHGQAGPDDDIPF